MKPSDFFMFAVFVVMMMATSAYVGHQIGLMDGAREQKIIDNKKLQQANMIIAGDMYEK